MLKTTLPVSNELRETLSWATGRLREIYGPRLKRLILFGSQARGEADPESDVDVLVVLEGPNGAYEEAKRTSPVATKAAAYRDTALSFVHMSEEEFTMERSPLVWSVREDGIDLLRLFPEGASLEDASLEDTSFGSTVFCSTVLFRNLPPPVGSDTVSSDTTFETTAHPFGAAQTGWKEPATAASLSVVFETTSDSYPHRASSALWWGIGAS